MAIVGNESQGQPEQPPLADRPLRKSPAAFRTIAEVAGELDLPAHVLRFWESKFPQVKPLKRRGGRRYYRPEDVALLRHIRTLLYTDGYTIRGVQRLLKETGSKPVPGHHAPAGDIAPGDPPPADLQGEIDLALPAPADGPEAGDDGEGFADPELAEPGLAEQALVDLLDELEAIRALLRSHGF